MDAPELVPAFVDYLRRRNYSPASLRNREAYVRRLIADLDPFTATAFEIEEWCYSHGWKPQSMNGAITALRKFFTWLAAAGHRADNPTLELLTVPVRQRRPRIATDADIVAALGRARLPVQVMILLAAECGLRRAEIAKVHRDDIEGEWLRVVGKGDRERFVMLPAHLLERIGRLPGRGYLFPAPVRPERTHGTYAMFQAGCRDEGTCPGHPVTRISCRQANRDAQTRSRHGVRLLTSVDNERHITPDAVYQVMRRALGMNPHSLRHRAATAVYQGTGHDIRVTQEFLGHASPAMTARYVHVSDRDLRLASDAAVLSIHRQSGSAEVAG